MKYAIISDIHSNLNALKLVLADIKQFNVDSIYNLGDIVGYGNQPTRFKTTIREWCKIGYW